MSTALTSIIGSASPAVLSPFAEADLIEQAQDGDHEALLDLMRQYAPVLRRLRGVYSDLIGAEDCEQELMLAFTEMVRSHDAAKNPRLAGRINQQLTDAMTSAASSYSSGFSIPVRTMKRYLGILKRADQDVTLARTIAPEYGMSEETFDLVLRAARTDAGVQTDDDGYGSVAAGVNVAGMFAGNDVEESIELARFAMDAVRVDELTVIRRAYGFDPIEVDGSTMLPTGAAPLADGFIAASMELSRVKVQRLRTSALRTMREALGVDGEVA